jgi:hypothetical protein
MAIPQGEISVVPVPSAYGPPEDRKFYPLTSYEKGPLAIEDTTLGLQYQNWTVTWDADTNLLTAFPETTGIAESLVTITEPKSLSFTFDQSGRISFAYTTAVSSYLYWYNTETGLTETLDLGADAITPALLLDDKRITQNTANDMLLWYTKANGGAYDLYMRVQRDRFLIEYLMASGLGGGFIQNIGMNSGLRIQMTIRGTKPQPAPPPPVNDPNNLDFESGDVNWTQETGTEWSINQNDPYAGSWNASLISTGAYSLFVNDHYFPVTGNQSVTIKMFAKGTIGPGLSFGFAAYDAGFVKIGGNQLGINVTADWLEEEWTANVPANAAYIRAVVQSNGEVGTYHVDNFTVIT